MEVSAAVGMQKQQGNSDHTVSSHIHRTENSENGFLSGSPCRHFSVLPQSKGINELPFLCGVQVRPLEIIVHGAFLWAHEEMGETDLALKKVHISWVQFQNCLLRPLVCWCWAVCDGVEVSGTQGGMRWGTVLLLAAQGSRQHQLCGQANLGFMWTLLLPIASGSGQVGFLSSLSLMVFICEVGIRILTLLDCCEG